MEQANYKELQNKIGVKFKDNSLLKQAFIHRSYLNEHPECLLEHNERLEFLGDAIIEMIVTEHLYNNYPNPEGELTIWRSALVKGETLAKVAKKLNLDRYILMSKGENFANGSTRKIILANTFEALVGSIYLEFGYEISQQFLVKFLISLLPRIIEEKQYFDAKSQLQEWAQQKMSITPRYDVIKESGPDHQKIFEVGVYVGDKLIAQGKGSSKQKAQQDAAEKALKLQHEKFNSN